MNKDGSLTLLHALNRDNKYIKCKMGVVCVHSVYVRKILMLTQIIHTLECPPLTLFQNTTCDDNT